MLVLFDLKYHLLITRYNSSIPKIGWELSREVRRVYDDLDEFILTSAKPLWLEGSSE